MKIMVWNNARDNNRKVGVKKFIAEHPQIKISIVEQPIKGLHHAREAGLRAAQNGIFPMTDADISFPKNWLQLIQKHFTNPAIQAITGICRFNDAFPVVNLVTHMQDD